MPDDPTTYGVTMPVDDMTDFRRRKSVFQALARDIAEGPGTGLSVADAMEKAFQAGLGMGRAGVAVTNEPAMSDPEALVETWRQVSQGILALRSGADNDERKTVDGYFRRYGEALAAAGSWPPEIRAKLTAHMPLHFLVELVDRLYLHQSHQYRSRATVAKVVSLAHTLVTAGPAAVPPHEAKEMLHALRHAGADLHRHEGVKALGALLSQLPAFPTSDARKPSVDMIGGMIRHEFTYPWWKRSGSGKSAAVHVGVGVACIESIDAEDAPVVVRLKRLDGGWLDVRRHGGSWFRPVHAPGTWDGVDLDAYLGHVSEAPAWADNPFLPWPRGYVTPLPLSMFMPEPCLDEAAHLADKAKDERATLDGLGRIALIDGIVHRQTREPVLTLVPTSADAFCPGWAMEDDLVSVDPMSTLMGSDTDPALWGVRHGRRDVPCITLPPTCGQWMGDLVDAAIRHRAARREAYDVPYRQVDRDAAEARRTGLYGSGLDRVARVVVPVEEWEPAGIMSSLAARARRLTQPDRYGDRPAAEVVARLADFSGLLDAAAEAMTHGRIDHDAVTGASLAFRAWEDAPVDGDVGLDEVLIATAARLCIDRFDLALAVEPARDADRLMGFSP